MTNEMTIKTNAAISTSETIEANIPKTNDYGDALLAAQRILAASYRYCCTVGDMRVPAEVRRIVLDSRDYVGKQYADYLKGE